MTKEEIYQAADNLEQELTKIYMSIMQADEISFYRQILLTKKVCLLASQGTELMKELKKLDKNKNTKNVIKAFIMLIFSTVFLVISFFKPTLGLIGSGIVYYKYWNFLNDLPTPKEKKEEQELLSKQLRDIGTIMTNCTTFLEVKVKKRENKLAEQRALSGAEYLDVDLAYKILDLYLEGKEIVLTDQIEKALITILQEDMESSETDVYKLMELAKTKIQSENLENELNLTRILSKKEEK